MATIPLGFCRVNQQRPGPTSATGCLPWNLDSYQNRPHTISIWPTIPSSVLRMYWPYGVADPVADPRPLTAPPPVAAPLPVTEPRPSGSGSPPRAALPGGVEWKEWLKVPKSFTGFKSYLLTYLPSGN